MAVVNFKVNKLTGERKEKKVGNVTARANSTIVSLKKAKEASIGEYLLVNFKYDVVYEPDIGGISIEGSLWYVHPKLDKVVKEKDDDKIELENEVVKEISTAVIRDCMLESLYVAREIQLPPPIKLPSVEVKPKQVKFKKAS